MLGDRSAPRISLPKQWLHSLALAESQRASFAALTHRGVIERAKRGGQREPRPGTPVAASLAHVASWGYAVENGVSRPPGSR